MCYIDFIYDLFLGHATTSFFSFLGLPKIKEETLFATTTPNFRFKLNKLSKHDTIFLKDVIEFWNVCYDIIIFFCNIIRLEQIMSFVWLLAMFLSWPICHFVKIFPRIIFCNKPFFFF